MSESGSRRLGSRTISASKCSVSNIPPVVPPTARSISAVPGSRRACASASRAATTAMASVRDQVSRLMTGATSATVRPGTWAAHVVR